MIPANRYPINSYSFGRTQLTLLASAPNTKTKDQFDRSKPASTLAYICSRLDDKGIAVDDALTSRLRDHLKEISKINSQIKGKFFSTFPKVQNETPDGLHKATQHLSQKERKEKLKQYSANIEPLVKEKALLNKQFLNSLDEKTRLALSEISQETKKDHHVKTGLSKF